LRGEGDTQPKSSPTTPSKLLTWYPVGSITGTPLPNNQKTSLPSGYYLVRTSSNKWAGQCPCKREIMGMSRGKRETRDKIIRHLPGKNQSLSCTRHADKDPGRAGAHAGGSSVLRGLLISP